MTPERLRQLPRAIDARMVAAGTEFAEWLAAATDTDRAVARAAFGLGYSVGFHERPPFMFGKTHGYQVAKVERPKPESWPCESCGTSVSSQAMTCTACGSPNLEPPGPGWQPIRELWSYEEAFELARACGLSEEVARKYAFEISPRIEEVAA